MVVEPKIALQPDKRDPLTVPHDPFRGACLVRLSSPLQASLQQVMEPQSRSHFFLQLKGRWHCRQIFSGKSVFLTAFPLILMTSDRKGVSPVSYPRDGPGLPGKLLQH